MSRGSRRRAGDVALPGLADDGAGRAPRGPRRGAKREQQEPAPRRGKDAAERAADLRGGVHSAVPFQVQVVRSKRRTRTVGAQLKGGVLHVSVPSWMSKADEAAWVQEMARRFARKASTEGIDLAARAHALAERYRLPLPASVSWVDMTTRWGSCTPATRTIRISSRLAPYPSWVLDYVLVHELAHLAVPDHSAGFWALVGRYPKAERARGFLAAKSGDDDGEPD